MLITTSLRVYWLALSVGKAVAFAIKEDAAVGNSTTPAEATTTREQPLFKPHPELSATGFEPPTEATTARDRPQFRPHGELSATGFEQPVTTPLANVHQSPNNAPDDVGSIIASIIHSEAPAVHFESTATGFEQQPRIQGIPTGNSNEWPTESAGQRIEVTTRGWATDKPVTEAAPVITPPPALPPVVTHNSRTLRPIPATSVVIAGQTLTPGGETVTIGEGESAVEVHLDPSGLPVVVVGGQTSTHQFPQASTVIEGQTLTLGGPPITIGSGWSVSTISINDAGETLAVVQGATTTLSGPSPQTFTVGDVVATAEASQYNYIIDSSTLAVNQAVTIDGVAYALTTDSSGSTLLIAGDTTRTLPAFAQTNQMTVEPLPFAVSTSVIDGTTNYIIGSQTLAPGHPITMNGTEISITTTSGVVVLVVGDMTTTVSDGTRRTAGPTEEIAAATPVGPGSGPNASATGKKGAAERNAESSRGVCLGALGVVVALLGLG
ncbi:hypothetical protein BDV95DRAFT_612516 [Massariosphaeria phaeospora]|uniref:Uncharacterized protein n=1 Tax=Massariosphaeria phaeospora TaxID=100035 RepID=A0A7C8M7A1_9PLEO|nr:hypothetical protein BDV95DRAFT_612516 [Massariosphaeria phaeospora]